jgi:hypothetical protein
MSQDPLEVVRAAEERLTQRLADAAASTAVVDAARKEAAAILAAARRAAAARAAARAAEIAAAGRAKREVWQAAAAARAEALRRWSARHRDRDVAAVVEAVLPVGRAPSVAGAPAQRESGRAS